MTPQELLKVVRYYTHDQVSIFIFEHGTVVTSLIDAEDAKNTLKKVFDIPYDGEGGEKGDIHPMSMDDGNTLYSFAGFACFAVRTPADMLLPPPTPASKTEVFQVESKAAGLLQDIRHGIAARAMRTKDAREGNIVESFLPSPWPPAGWKPGDKAR